MLGISKWSLGSGTMIKGWDIPENHFRDKNKLPVVDLAVMTNKCPWDCEFCFTDKFKKTLTLKEIKNLIDQLADRGTYAIDYLGEGEPTLDDDMFEILNYTTKKGIIPLLYTAAATKLVDRDYVKELYDTGASVLPKLDSLYNAEYQNSVVSGKRAIDHTYFDKRNKAIELLMEEGFNKINPDGTTRMGFDMVLSSKNYTEVEKTLRYCRENNLYIMFAFHLPSGRESELNTDFDIDLALNPLKRRDISDLVEKIDKEYGLERDKKYNNFLTGPCKEYMMIRANGDVQPCPGNETVIGNIKNETLNEIDKRILEKYAFHDRESFDGNCPYRYDFEGNKPTAWS